MKKKCLLLLSSLGIFMMLFLTACSQEEGAEKMSETTFFIIAFAIIFVMIVGVSLAVGIPIRKAQEKQRRQQMLQNQQSEYLNRAERRARQYKGKKKQ